MSDTGCQTMRAVPDSWFVPERLTALATMPAARPNSAVIPPRLTLNSWMSSSFTSVCKVPNPGFVMLTPSMRYTLSWRLPPADTPMLLRFSATPGTRANNPL